MRHLIDPRFILQHDNNLKHTVRVIKNYLQRQAEKGVLQQMVWPPQSPDLNTHGVSLGLYEETEAAEMPKSTEELW